MSGSTAAADGPPDHSTGEGEHGQHGDEHRSRWPFVVAIGAGALYGGVALTVLGADTGVFPVPIAVALAALGAVGLVAGLAGWVVGTFVAGTATEHDHRRRTYLATMVLFLATDVGTFGAGFVYYFFVRADPWPTGHVPELLGSLVVANTLVLVASSATLHLAHRALERGRRSRFLAWLGLTVVLGAVFLGGQALEYYEFVVREGFTLTTGVFGSAFYALTGLHGFHVALGVVFLLVVFGRALRGGYAPDRDTSVATASLYWHFVDAVWLFLVAVLYVGAGG